MSAVAHIDEYKTGRFYGDEFRGSLSWNGYENNVLLRNDGNDPTDGVPRFTDVGMALGADDVYDSRGVAVADYDNDGDLDILVNHSQGDNARDEAAGVPPVLLRNDMGAGRSWLAVELVGVESPRQPAGAVVRVETDGVTQTRLLSVGSSYASQQSDRLYFGLAGAESIDALEVVWPSGRRDRFGALAARALLRIEEGGSLERVELEASRDRARLSSTSQSGTPVSGSSSDRKP